MVDRARSASLLAFEDASGSPQKKSYCKTPEERFSTTMAFSQLGKFDYYIDGKAFCKTF